MATSIANRSPFSSITRRGSNSPITNAAVNGLPDDQLREHLEATGFFKEIDDPKMGALRFPGAPVRLDRRQLPVGMAPRLGEHTHQVLREAGIAPLGTSEPPLQGAPI